MSWALVLRQLTVALVTEYEILNWIHLQLMVTEGTRGVAEKQRDGERQA